MVATRTTSVGDVVSFTLGTTSIQGVVVDDRGPIGANGVRIFRVRIPNDPYDEDVIEVPEDELSPALNAAEPMGNDDIVNYLGGGGLIQILKSNTSAGKNQPMVWLRRDSLGNIVHTFIAEHGRIGGAAVPVLALHENRVFAPKLKDVLKFLCTFGLSKGDAAQVVDAVGTAP